MASLAKLSVIRCQSPVAQIGTDVQSSWCSGLSGFVAREDLWVRGWYTPASTPGATPMNDVTRILSEIGQGDPQAAGRLMPLVYDELRRLAAARMANEAAGNTLTPTALVHEAYLRLVG